MAATWSASVLVYFILSPTFSTLMVFLNILSMVIFMKKMRLASLSLLMLINITACDMLVCIFSNNFYIYNLWTPPFKWNTGSISCKIYKTTTMMMNISQILSLTVLSYDRMRRMTFSTVHQWNKKNGIIFLCFIWLASVILTQSRWNLFDEIKIKTFRLDENQTVTWNCNCKPIDPKSTWYITWTLIVFVFGYACPAACIITTLVRSQRFIKKHEVLMQSVNDSYASSSTNTMNRKLSWAFNILGLLYILIWTPFFVLTVIDLRVNLLFNKNFVDLNFGLRCTLLVLGSGKPIIYILFLSRFRHEFFKMCNWCNLAKSVQEESELQSTSHGSSNVT